MTINIALAVSEGLVMAADSLSQMTPKGGRGAKSVHQSVEKITELRGRSIALMVNGLGEIKLRTIVSLIREFEFEVYRDPKSGIREWPVSRVASELCRFLSPRYDAEYPQQPVAATPSQHKIDALESEPQKLGIIVGGYSPGEFFPEIVEIAFPGPRWRRLLPDGQGAPIGMEYVNFWGHTTAIDRLWYGYDVNSLQRRLDLLQAVDDLRKGTERALQSGITFEHLPEEYRRLPPPPSSAFKDDFDVLKGALAMNARLRGMPLQEAVEFVKYLGDTAIGFDRFCMGLPFVGGDLDVVAIQPDGLNWYSRKSFVNQMAQARERTIRAEEASVYQSLFTQIQGAAAAMLTPPASVPVTDSKKKTASKPRRQNKPTRGKGA